MAAVAPRVRRIGLTGGIGSGKSAVATAFAALGAEIVDTDAIARAVTAAGGRAMPALREAFGDDYVDVDGALDRERMRALAFGDPNARRRLEAIVHPLIGEIVRERIEAAGERVVVCDVPLLVESGRWRAQVERVLVVDCRVETQIARVQRRSGWPTETIERVIAQQATRAQRRAAADAVLWNDDRGLADLQRDVSALWQRWCRDD